MSAATQDVVTANGGSRSNGTSPSPRTFDPGQNSADAHASGAGVDHLSSETSVQPIPKTLASRSTPDAVGHSARDTPEFPADGYLSLRALAEIYEDVQRVRIAVENRVHSLAIEADLIRPRLDGLVHSEHQIGLLLQRTYRRVVEPEIVAWQRETTGIGEKACARLLGVIGHPVHTVVHAWEGAGSERELVVVGEKERRVSDLWSYCGHGDPTRKPRRGMSAADAAASGNPRAKMLVHVMAEAACKEPGRKVELLLAGEQDLDAHWPYRRLYEELRLRYEARDDWTPGHRHNSALRLVGKEILRDLWTAAR